MQFLMRHRGRIPFLLTCALVVSNWTQLFAQVQTPLSVAPPGGQFKEQSFHDEAGDAKYVVFVPANYRADKPSPAILFLHGAGERGSDNQMQLTVGLAPFIQARSKTFPFVVVFPQCRMSDGRILQSWDAGSLDGKRALAALDDARKHYNFDPHRVVLTGWSMGGYGAWSLGIAEPSRWSAIVPLSGGGDASKVSAIKDIPVWAFHGARDGLIKAESHQKMVDALKEAGGKATFTVLPEGVHDISAEVYGNDAVVAWMLNPGAAPAELGTATVAPVAAVRLPFVPALEIPSAVGLRLGNEVLDALSYAIPDRISPNMLNGRLNDMFDSTVAQGRNFSIQFYGITYNAQLERIAARGYGKDRLLVQLGIRNVVLTIGGTSVTGERHSAQAGPIAIRIGQRYPVWLNLELSPYVAERKLRLRLIGAGFQIPQDNWSVSSPAGVSVQGFGMTQEAVVSGLTSGLYGAKGRIENEVIKITPRIVEEIEKNLILPDSGSPASQSGSAISKIWPLPMSAPRFQAWPEKIVADENGLSVLVGLTVADPNPFAEAKQVRRASDASVEFEEVPADKSMHFVVTPRILSPIMDLLIQNDQTQLDLSDIPEPLFAKLADTETLKEIIPDLAQYGDALRTQSTVRVLQPIVVSDSDSSPGEDGHKPFDVRLPKVSIDVKIKSSDQSTKWQPCATFELTLTEQMNVSLKKPAHDLRVVSLEWLNATQVKGTGQFAESYDARDKTLHADRFLELFKQAWAKYFEDLKNLSSEAPDLPVGNSKFRLADLKWSPAAIDVTYRLSRIKLTNLSDEPFTYQTKAPTSAWGEPLTLKPGNSHEFEIPYPLTYRRNLPTGAEVYTLPVGSHSEFRVPVTGGPPRLFQAKRPQ